jgi:hypothetical protein
MAHSVIIKCEYIVKSRTHQSPFLLPSRIASPSSASTRATPICRAVRSQRGLRDNRRINSASGCSPNSISSATTPRRTNCIKWRATYASPAHPPSPVLDSFPNRSKVQPAARKSLMSQCESPSLMRKATKYSSCSLIYHCHPRLRSQSNLLLRRLSRSKRDWWVF